MLDWNYFLKKDEDGQIFYEGYKNSKLHHNGSAWVNGEQIPLGRSTATFKLEEKEIEMKYPTGVFNATIVDING